MKIYGLCEDFGKKGLCDFYLSWSSTEKRFTDLIRTAHFLFTGEETSDRYAFHQLPLFLINRETTHTKRPRSQAEKAALLLCTPNTQDYWVCLGIYIGSPKHLDSGLHLHPASVKFSKLVISSYILKKKKQTRKNSSLLLFKSYYHLSPFPGMRICWIYSTLSTVWSY